MTPFTALTGVAVPVKLSNVDTGMILPGRFMRRHRRPGHDYAEAFLHDLRIGDDGKPIPDCTLNLPIYKNATIIVTGADFGCGSSREGAAYAVMDYGFKALIGCSFAEIFYNNCLQIGLLPVVLPEEAVDEVFAYLAERPGAELTVDLINQQVADATGRTYRFEMNQLRKERMVSGLDDIDVTSMFAPQIDVFEARRRDAYPWLPDVADLRVM